jgi:hypothetical protein
MNRRRLVWALAISIVSAGLAVRAADPTPALAVAAPAPTALAATNVIGPKIQFETVMHDFGRAKSGEVVKYTYIFTNTGDQALELSGVQACGCITADWTKKVEPGKTGTIPISFNSAGYAGPVAKGITVTCNDRTNPHSVLQFRGALWKAIDVNPQYAVLNLTADAPLASVTVLITNNLEEPITVFAPQCNNPAFTAVLKTNQPGKEFRVVIAPAAPLPPGYAQAMITLKTSSTNVPVVVVTAVANVQPAVTLTPSQIVLPAAPLARPQTNTISIIGHSTNVMTLSEPTVNATGVNVQVRAVLPGRQFVATLIFPEGLEITRGQKTELSIKSTLPQAPSLKVPILQAPRPAPPPVTPLQASSSVVTNQLRAQPQFKLPPLPPIPSLPRPAS